MALNLDLMTILKLMGGGIAFIVTSGFTFFKIYDAVQVRREKRAEKEDERRYERELQLERDKVELQKELETQKQRHVQKLIDAIREEMGKLEREVKRLSESFVRVDERLKSTADKQESNVKMVNDFIQTTKNRFRILEQEVKNGDAEVREYVKTEIRQIKEDLIIVKGIAKKLRDNKQTTKGG